MSGQERHCNLKRQRKDLIHVLQRPVEITTQTGPLSVLLDAESYTREMHFCVRPDESKRYTRNSKHYFERWSPTLLFYTQTTQQLLCGVGCLFHRGRTGFGSYAEVGSTSYQQLDYL